jgi:putative ABC transport system ATP-binding protein
VFVTHEPDIAVFTKRTIMLRDGNVFKDFQQETQSAKNALENIPEENDYQ